MVLGQVALNSGVLQKLVKIGGHEDQIEHRLAVRLFDQPELASERFHLMVKLIGRRIHGRFPCRELRRSSGQPNGIMANTRIPEPHGHSFPSEGEIITVHYQRQDRLFKDNRTGHIAGGSFAVPSVIAKKDQIRQIGHTP